MNRNRRKQNLPIGKVSKSEKNQKSPSEKVSNSQKKQKLSQEKNSNAEENLGERIARLEEELADKGSQLNLTNVLNKEEQKEIRKLQPKVKEMLTQIQNEQYELIMEKIQLENSLREKELLLRKSQDFEKRLITAKAKLDDISNYIVKTNDAASNINSLPDEILLKIFGQIKQNKLGQIARVCRKWNVLTKSPVLWKIVDIELYQCDTEFDEFQTETVKMFVQTLPSCVSCIKLDLKDEYWDEEEEWEYTGNLNFKELCVMLQEKCPHLEMLMLYNAQISHSLPSVIDLCTDFLQNVRRLGFYHSRFVDHWPLREEDCDDSKIEVLDIVDCGFREFNIPPILEMPSLRVLNLHRTSINNLWPNDDTCFLNQLEVLNLGFTEIEYHRALQVILSDIVNLKELYLCEIDASSDLNFNDLEFPHLKTICLASDRVTCKNVISVIQSCQSLENVYVNDNVAKSYAKHPFVAINRCKLKIVKSNNLCKYHQKIDY